MSVRSVVLSVLLSLAVAAEPAPGKPYRVELTAPAAAAVGKVGAAQVRVVPAEGYHTNKEFPTKLTVTAPAAVTVARATQSAADAKAFSPDRLEFEVGFTATAAGAHEILGDLRFAVCTPQTCIPVKEKVTWKVAVK